VHVHRVRDTASWIIVEPLRKPGQRQCGTGHFLHAQSAASCELRPTPPDRPAPVTPNPEHNPKPVAKVLWTLGGGKRRYWVQPASAVGCWL